MYDVITVHKMAKKQKVFAEIENFIPIGFRLQIKLTALIERSATKVLEFTYILCNRNDILRAQTILF